MEREEQSAMTAASIMTSDASAFQSILIGGRKKLRPRTCTHATPRCHP
jgi:hypothetical protein